MIRLRVERFQLGINEEPVLEGVVYFEGGAPVGRVVIEQTITDPPLPEWEPVEVLK